jgi:hypothetical protein
MLHMTWRPHKDQYEGGNATFRHRGLAVEPSIHGCMCASRSHATTVDRAETDLAVRFRHCGP